MGSLPLMPLFAAKQDANRTLAQGSPSFLGSLPCPEHGYLQAPGVLEETLRLRSINQLLVVLSYGWTNGDATISMRSAGERFVVHQVERLVALRLENYLVVSTWLQLPHHKMDNPCRSQLRREAICCAWSSVGVDAVGPGRPGANWSLTPTHPYLLFLQRWWLTSHATARGHAVLSLDADLHLWSHPLALLATGALARHHLVTQADTNWPIALASAEPAAPRLPRCAAGGCTPRVACAAAPHAARGECACAATPPPSLNTGFVYARAHPAVAEVFNATIRRILARIRAPPQLGRRGEVLLTRVWPQDVLNEVVHARAAAPAAAAAAADCHADDASCQPRMHASLRARVTAEPQVPMWWVGEAARAARGAWQAAHAPRDDGACAPHAALVAWSELPGGATVAAAPRSAVGRVCGTRHVPLTQAGFSLQELVSTQPALACDAYGGQLLRQEVSHMQFTSMTTRMRTFEYLHWWPSPRPRNATTSCAEAALSPSARPPILVSSSMLTHSYLCVDSLQTRCPCCWRAPPSIAASTTGCRVWNTKA
ncbi:hypothetical protein AB1Y20_012334 [Prymnesium parvum]|uniref:Nucleotide-diphospho-sugar transferase domain-containing protein n=1 Tax=Prymnesium parvum TaxID=97485 RepID=A0AB34IP51_PRYPA